ncbi:MAG: hypothetical protein ACTSUE_23050 [Promethearchaeota archaeon]
MRDTKIIHSESVRRITTGVGVARAIILVVPACRVHGGKVVKLQGIPRHSKALLEELIHTNTGRNKK